MQVLSYQFSFLGGVVNSVQIHTHKLKFISEFCPTLIHPHLLWPLVFNRQRSGTTYNGGVLPVLICGGLKRGICLLTADDRYRCQYPRFIPHCHGLQAEHLTPPDMLVRPYHSLHLQLLMVLRFIPLFNFSVFSLTFSLSISPFPPTPSHSFPPSPHPPLLFRLRAARMPRPMLIMGDTSLRGAGCLLSAVFLVHNYFTSVTSVSGSGRAERDSRPAERKSGWRGECHKTSLLATFCPTPPLLHLERKKESKMWEKERHLSVYALNLIGNIHYVHIYSQHIC